MLCLTNVRRKQREIIQHFKLSIEKSIEKNNQNRSRTANCEKRLEDTPDHPGSPAAYNLRSAGNLCIFPFPQEQNAEKYGNSIYN